MGVNWFQMGRCVGISHFFLPGNTRTTPGKRLVSWKLNVFLRFAPFRIACKPSVPKVECLSTLEIECFFATKLETRETPGDVQVNYQVNAKSGPGQQKLNAKVK